MKLTKAQRRVLEDLQRYGKGVEGLLFTVPATMDRLQQKGLVARVDRNGVMAKSYLRIWQITEAGLAAIAKAEGRT